MLGASESRNGTLFDGQYVYLVPSTFTAVLRFKARNAPLATAGRAVSSF